MAILRDYFDPFTRVSYNILNNMAKSPDSGQWKPNEVLAWALIFLLFDSQ